MVFDVYTQFMSVLILKSNTNTHTIDIPLSRFSIVHSLVNTKLGYSHHIMMVMYQNRMPKNDTSAKRPLIYNSISASEIEHY